MDFCSQQTQYLPIQQDKFVCETLNYKKNGTFLDLGCNDFKYINNTYYLESVLNWTGVSIDLQSSYENGWKNRNSVFLVKNAVEIDYQQLLTEYKMPDVIDYLSIDLEPPHISLRALEKVFESNFSFNVVTFETDYYREESTRMPSRELLLSKGFTLIHESPQDDYYVHKRILST